MQSRNVIVNEIMFNSQKVIDKSRYVIYSKITNCDKEGEIMRIVDERKKLGLSQLEAAKKMGLAKSSLAMIETGQRSGTDRTKKKIAKFYGKRVGYLFFDE